MVFQETLAPARILLSFGDSSCVVVFIGLFLLGVPYIDEELGVSGSGILVWSDSFHNLLMDLRRMSCVYICLGFW